MKKVLITFEIRGWDDCPDLSPILEGATETAGDLAGNIEAIVGLLWSDLSDRLEEHVSVEWVGSPDRAEPKPSPPRAPWVDNDNNNDNDKVNQ